MSAAEVTAYIEALDEPKRSTLLAMRAMLLEIEPGLEQAFAWRSAMFKFGGKYVAGLCAHKNHMTFSPQSSDVMAAHAEDLAGYVVSKGSFQFAIDQPLPKALVEKLLKARLDEL
jgi:uncharacterized protein YdhG (YjbR/CyaY superfamily)